MQARLDRHTLAIEAWLVQALTLLLRRTWVLLGPAEETHFRKVLHRMRWRCIDLLRHIERKRC